MKIIVLVRQDFFKKRGGDTIQIEAYCSRFNDVEYCADPYAFGSKNIRAADRIVLTNIDVVDQFLLHARFILNNELQNKTYIVPIHHDFFMMGRFFSKQLSLNIFGIERINPFLTYFLRSALRALVSFELRNFISMVSYPRSMSVIRKIISECAGLILIADKEAVSLGKDFGIRIPADRYVVIRNGVADNFTKEIAHKINSRKNRDIDILVVGRIEPRKNQLGILRALCGSNYKVRLIGALNYNHPNYSQKVLKLINENPNWDYEGSISSEDTLHFYLRSKCVLSASFFEVSSLVDIEAYCCGCYLITTKYGYSDEIFNDFCVEYIDPYGLHYLRHRVKSIIENFQEFNCSDNYKKISNWSDAAAKFSNFISRTNFA